MKYLAIIIIIAIALSLGVGYAVLSDKSSSKPAMNSENKTTEQKGQNTSKAPPANPDIKTSPTPKQQKVVKVEELAVNRQSISISNCEANPPVVKTKTGNRVSITNNDIVDRTFANGQNKLVVKGKSTGEMAVTQDGALAYTCDADKRGSEPVFVIIGENR